MPFGVNAAHLFSQLVSRRYENTGCVGEWGSVFGDAVVATAILDGLLHHSTVITTPTTATDSAKSAGSAFCRRPDRHPKGKRCAEAPFLKPLVICLWRVGRWSARRRRSLVSGAPRRLSRNRLVRL
ncbi:ATP-binding protein [Mesorhizobium sp. AR02]|uniref:ATP-binding protein n=1 Tax=Mesorhizobium sp. AR02 TaxID=2865837 RepID=UPI003A5C49DE